MVLDVDHITERSTVVQQIQRQARAGKRSEMILAEGLSKDVRDNTVLIYQRYDYKLYVLT